MNIKYYPRVPIPTVDRAAFRQPPDLALAFDSSTCQTITNQNQKNQIKWKIQRPFGVHYLAPSLALCLSSSPIQKNIAARPQSSPEILVVPFCATVGGLGWFWLPKNVRDGFEIDFSMLDDA